MARLSQKQKACKYLELPQGFEPSVKISHIFEDITLAEIVSCLRTSPEESAQMICALADRLPTPSAMAIDIDYLIAAARIRDPHKIAGLICECYSRVKAMESQIVAAKNSPDIMRNVSEHGKQMEGFRQAQMVLQTSGVAPLPKTQIGGKSYNFTNIDQSKNLNISVPSQHGIVNEVSDIFSKLPQPRKDIINVPSRENSGQDSADRAREED